MQLDEYDRKHGLLGNGEIHVPGKDHLIYVAPRLVVHYVTKHNYMPPAEYISAVENLPFLKLLLMP